MGRKIELKFEGERLRRLQEASQEEKKTPEEFCNFVIDDCINELQEVKNAEGN